MNKQPDIVDFPLPADEVKGCPPHYFVIDSAMIGRCCKPGCTATVDYTKKQSFDPAYQSNIRNTVAKAGGRPRKK